MKSDAAIVLVTTSYPRQGDGSEAAGGFVADLAGALVERCPVRVVAPGDRPGMQEAREGADVFRFHAPERPLSTLRPWRPSEAADIVRVWTSGRQATLEAVRAGPTRGILALWALPSGDWARSASRTCRVPYVVWTLGSDIWTYGRIPGVRHWLNAVLGGARLVFSDGLQLAEDTRRIATRDVQFLPSTRRIDEARPQGVRPSPPYRLLFLGRWHPNKGIDLLLDALGRLDDGDWQRIGQVEIFGGGPMHEQVHAAVAGLVSAGRPVSLGGYLDKQQAVAALARADWLLIPSRIESIPVVFSDAMKLQLPVVSMPVGDLPTLVTQAPACGLLADRVDAAAFAGAIRAALASNASAFQSGVDERKARFDLDAIRDRLLSCWDED